jgi:two-component system, sensor histidine kinase LadS
LNKVDFPTLGKPTIPHFKLMAIPQKQAGKCMRCLLRAAAAWLALLLGSALQGAFAAAPEPPVVTLGATQTQLQANELGTAWLDERGTATFEQVLQRDRAGFMPGQRDRIWSLGERGHLWIHWRLMRSHDEDPDWVLAFPMPTLDSVTVYQQNSRGKWVARSAGDTMAVTSWPQPGRYPHFHLDLPPGQPRDVYVRIQNLTPANFPSQLLSVADYHEGIQVEYLGLGLTFGALLLLIAACLAQSVAYRDGVYGWYAIYGLVTTLCMAAYTGAAAHLLWPGFAAMGDAPQGILALLAGAAALLFVRNLIGIAARHHLLNKSVQLAGFAGIALAIVYPFVNKPTGTAIVAVYVVGVTVANLWLAFSAWRRGDVVGAWVLAASAPLCLAVLMTVMRLFGWLPVFFGTQYAIVVGMALEVPLLLVALTLRSRDRHGAQIRELALSSQDALTGLLAPHLFHDRLRQVVARYKRHGDNAAVVLIDLVNYPAIKAHFGTAVAEQSLLRSVIKLRRLLRDVDTVSRIGEARFGLILEGQVSRVAVTERAARLIAAGLMPLEGLKPDVTLQFHIGCVLLDERLAEPEFLVDGLTDLLAGMSPRTRRPIRFLEPEVTQPAPFDSDSALLGSDSGTSEPGTPQSSVRTATVP